LVAAERRLPPRPSWPLLPPALQVCHILLAVTDGSYPLAVHGGSCAVQTAQRHCRTRGTSAGLDAAAVASCSVRLPPASCQGNVVAIRWSRN
jgi:hypothetical protein